MARRVKTSRSVLDQLLARASSTPWVCVHRRDGSDIEAFVEPGGPARTIAVVRASPGVNHKATAEFMVDAVNNYARDKQMIGDLVYALELCLTCDGLSWEAEHEADVLCNRLRRGD